MGLSRRAVMGSFAGLAGWTAFNASRDHNAHSDIDLSHITSLSDSRLGRPHDIEIRNGRAVTAGKRGTVVEINIKTPTRPAIESQSGAYENAETVAAYPVGHSASHWLIGDETALTSVSTAGTQPSVLDQTELDSARANGAAYHQTPDEDLILFVAEKAGSVSVYDVTEPMSLRKITAVPNDDASPHDIAIEGTELATVNQREQSTPKVTVRDAVTAAGHLKESWTNTRTLTDSRFDGANRIEAMGAGRFAVANNYANTIGIVRVTDNTVEVKDVVSVLGDNGPSGLVAFDQHLVTGSGNRLSVWRVDDIGRLEQVASHTLSGRYYHDMVSDGRYLFATGQGSDSIEVFDLGVELANQPQGSIARSS